MKNRRWRALLERGAMAGVALSGLPGCYDVKLVEVGVEAMPDVNGNVNVPELGVQGHWFVFGDQYDWPRSCTNIGKHTADECSEVDWPPPQARSQCDQDAGAGAPAQPESTSSPPAFPNEHGVMCTFGRVGKAVACDAKNRCSGQADAIPNCRVGYDYSNMWGAGMGLDFNLDVAAERDPRDRQVWNPRAHGVVGVAFDFELIDDGGLGAPNLRVEFPILLPNASLPQLEGSYGLSCEDHLSPYCQDATQKYPDDTPSSEEHPDGSPFWGAPPEWSQGYKSSPFGSDDVSPVREGHNVVRFSDVKPAPPFTPNEGYDYAFDETQLLGIQFHVPSMKAQGGDQHFGYGFCISNLTFLRE